MQGIQFVRQLQALQERPKQLAEVAVYFKRFDEAEAAYLAIDRVDLAIGLRTRLGMGKSRGWAPRALILAAAPGLNRDMAMCAHDGA